MIRVISYPFFVGTILCYGLAIHSLFTSNYSGAAAMGAAGTACLFIGVIAWTASKDD